MEPVDLDKKKDTPTQEHLSIIRDHMDTERDSIKKVPRVIINEVELNVGDYVKVLFREPRKRAGEWDYQVARVVTLAPEGAGKVKNVPVGIANAPLVQVQWFYDPKLITMRQAHRGVISEQEVFETNHVDWIWLQSVETTITVISGDEYIDRDIDSSQDIMFTRAKYDPETKRLTPKIDDWLIYCDCETPFNPDKIICECEGAEDGSETCSSWIHPNCFGFKDGQVDDDSIKMRCIKHGGKFVGTKWVKGQ